MMVSWMVLLLAIVVLAVVVAAGVARQRKGRRSSGRDEGAGCGHCGYDVRGLSTFICPECGNDLRSVGITTLRSGGTAGPRPPQWIDLLWLLPLLTVGCFALGLLFSQASPAGIVLPIAILVWVIGAGWLVHRRINHSGLMLTAFPGAAAGTGGARRPKPLDGAAHDQPGFEQPATTRTAVLTIMFIDVADFSQRTSATSRDGLIDLIRRVRDIVQPELSRRRGRIIKTIGDGFLIAFESPTEGVKCGGDIQHAVDRHSAAHTGDANGFRLRIGITTGEVALEDHDVYGEAVNLASRIQQLAAPGQVFFSESTWHAMNRTEVPHEPAGEFEVKGFNQAVRVYRATGA